MICHDKILSEIKIFFVYPNTKGIMKSDGYCYYRQHCKWACGTERAERCPTSRIDDAGAGMIVLVSFKFAY